MTDRVYLFSVQLSTSHLGSPSHMGLSHLVGGGNHAHHHHAPQLSTPVPLSSPRHLDFYDGISSAMASTARGPLGRLGQVRKDFVLARAY